MQIKSTSVIQKTVDTKSKDIAWIVSHCETPSHRESYVQGLTLSKIVNGLKVVQKYHK